ncbi:Cut9-interacting protein scn1 [Coemansia sp. Benny D115]|nr:Cut9-interacting protein scn1 [Coemansia sp. Benny D115]
MRFDTHCHIQEQLGAAEPFFADQGSSDRAFCALGTHCGDWVNVVAVKRLGGERVVAGFGVHPWFAEQTAADGSSSSSSSSAVREDWVAELRQLVQQHGGIVGECGLDKAARDRATGKVYSMAVQKQVLQAQLDIAAALSVPVSLHCVRAHGTLAEMLSAMGRAGALPPRIALHSYSGSADMLSQMFLRGELGRRVYVGFSAAVNARDAGSRQRAAECLRLVPEERILVESDLGDVRSSDAALGEAVTLVAEARGWSVDATWSRVNANARAFFAESIIS